MQRRSIAAILFALTPLVAPAQRAAVAVPQAGEVRLLGGPAPDAWGGMPTVRSVAFDGVARIWAVSGPQGTLHRHETGDPAGTVWTLPWAPSVVARHAAGAAVGFSIPSGAVGAVGLHDADGLVWSVFLDHPPHLVAVDRNQVIWAVTAPIGGAGLLWRLDSDGTLLGLHPAGIGPVAFAFDLAGHAWMVCATELRRYTAGGDLAATVPIDAGVTDITCFPGVGLVLARPGAQELELLDTEATAGLRVVTDPVEQVASDANGDTWAGAFWSGRVDRLSSAFAAEQTWSVSPWRLSTGLQDALGGGWDADPDGDGYASGEELTARTHPFDPASRPMGVVFNGAPVDGLQGLTVFAADHGLTPYWLAFALEGRARGAGPYGFSLTNDPVFGWTAWPVTSPLDSPFGMFDAVGASQRLLAVPAVVTGVGVAAGFVTLPALPTLAGSTASVADVLVLP